VTAQEPIKQFEPAVLPAPQKAVVTQKRALSLDDLLDKADEYGIAEVHMSKAAARYCGGKRLDQLNAGEIELLYNRLMASREQSGEDAQVAQEAEDEEESTAARNVAGKLGRMDSEASLPERMPTLSGARSNGRGRG
jgi:hypothetical protein